MGRVQIIILISSEKWVVSGLTCQSENDLCAALCVLQLPACSPAALHHSCSLLAACLAPDPHAHAGSHAASPSPNHGLISLARSLVHARSRPCLKPFQFKVTLVLYDCLLCSRLDQLVMSVDPNLGPEFAKLLIHFFFLGYPPVIRVALGRTTWFTVLCRKTKDWWHWDAGDERRVLRWWSGEVLWWSGEVPAVVRRWSDEIPAVVRRGSAVVRRWSDGCRGGTPSFSSLLLSLA
ncbi:hypothetical protein MA16_Dca008346 [Dendrobium catenatum]|uniref:Uncharacterized protein n=1 Tax=Dendrobium catenatum TaxID=906689 RepID=A0A2I0W828_9ASPA|nr:hypothetical protein MA16_Dca008346 [Dendrobium catenatum]